MMDDDFGDFTGFSQAQGTSQKADPKDSSKGASFPSKNGIGAMMNSVSDDSSTQGSSGITNFAQFDVNFDIPPPLSPPGTNVHVAGGVPFDIPPLPESFSFDDFTPDVESENAFAFPGNNLPATTSNETSVGGSVSHQSVVQPVAELSDFNSSAPVPFSVAPDKTQDEHKPHLDTTTRSASANDSHWAADFSIPPPVDTTEDLVEEKAQTHTTASSEASAKDSGWAADFGSFNIPPPIDTIEDIAEEKASTEKRSEPTPNKVLPDASTNEESEFGTFEGASVQTEVKAVPAPDKAEGGFGDFNAFSSTETAPNVTSNISDFTNFATFDTATPDSTSAKPASDNFGAFGTQSTSTDPHSFPSPSSSTSTQLPGLQNDNFGHFSSLNDPQNASSQNTVEPANSDFPSPDPAARSDKDSTTHATENFGAFESATKDDSTGQATSGFGAFETNTEQAAKSTDFGDFSTAFSDTQAASSTPTNNDFGDFSTGQSTALGDTNTEQTVTSSTQPSDDFGDFSTSSFGSKQAVASSTQPKDDFGDFSSGQSNFASFGDTKATGGDVQDEFGDFSGGTTGFSDFKTSSAAGDDEFSNFSSSSSTGFGAFSAAGTASSIPTPPVLTTKDASKVLLSSFPRVGLSAGDDITVSKFLTLLIDAKTLKNTDQSMWQSLQKCIDLTIPLYKWDRSSLQDDYYSAIKVDPMLISRPSTLSVLTGHAKFEDPLGGTTAAEDLMEAFGFEGEVEESRRHSASPPPLLARTPQKSEDRATPTLLDLSLPETPGSPSGHNSFTLTEDLLGLDLNPQPQNQQLTSIQELLRNERLVVNKSNWVDSKLEELGERGETTSSRPSTPGSVKRQNTVELQLQQLGLDANKVSSFTGGNRELSLAARTVLGRLPELSFMLDTDRIVQTNQYSI